MSAAARSVSVSIWARESAPGRARGSLTGSFRGASGMG